MIMRRFARALPSAALALALGAAPAAAVQPERAPGADCVLPPGVYGIVDSQGNQVGLQIVYPDCRMEVFKKQEPA